MPVTFLPAGLVKANVLMVPWATLMLIGSAGDRLVAPKPGSAEIVAAGAGVLEVAELVVGSPAEDATVEVDDSAADDSVPDDSAVDAAVEVEAATDGLEADAGALLAGAAALAFPALVTGEPDVVDVQAAATMATTPIRDPARIRPRTTLDDHARIFSSTTPLTSQCRGWLRCRSVSGDRARSGFPAPARRTAPE